MLQRSQLLMPLDIAKTTFNDSTIRKGGSVCRQFSLATCTDYDCQDQELLFVSKHSGEQQQPGQVIVENWGSGKDLLNRTCSEGQAATYASLLRRCGNVKALSNGIRVHKLILKSGHIGDTFLGNLLVQMYGKCAAMDDAISLFWEMPRRNVYSWNLLIGAYILNAQGVEALQLHQRMQQEGVMPDKVTFVSIISACVSQVALVEGKWLHVYILSSGFESDVVVGTALLNMYGKCCRSNDAERMFDKILDKNVISWNAMIAVYTEHGRGKDALQLFQHMELVGMIPNGVTFISLLHACSSQADLAKGQGMHVRILHSTFESDVVLDNALLNMYGKCGALELAFSMFTTVSQRDVITWNIMVESCVQHGQSGEALYLFQQMQVEGILPDDVTFVSVLSACVSQVALAEGEQLHSRVLSCRFESDVVVGTALVNMYAKCGSLDSAQKTFDEMPKRNEVSWNAMIAAYGQHGWSSTVLLLFQRMQGEGVAPNYYTFFSVLSACSHTGLLVEGCHCLCSMTRDHGIMPSVEHFNCVVDLLGRAGLLDEGEELINGMPCHPSPASWSALLNACRMHLDVERGKRIAEHVIRLDPESAVPYISLSNIYAAAGRWDDAASVREKIREQGLKKQPGRTIEDDFVAEEFLFEDPLCLQEEKTFFELQRLNMQMDVVVPGTMLAKHGVG